MKTTPWTQAGPKTWTKDEVTEALRDSQIGDQWMELNHLSSNRFRRIGRDNGLEVVITNEGNMLNAGLKFIATVKGRCVPTNEM